MIPLTITAVAAAYIIFVLAKSCDMPYPEAVMFRVFFLLVAPFTLLVVF